MKIWELLNGEHEGKVIRNEDNTIRLLIQKVEPEKEQNSPADEEPEFALVNSEGNRIAITSKILSMEWNIIPPSNWERVNEKEKYYYMDDKLDIKFAYDDRTLTDDLRFSNLNYFRTEELASDVRLMGLFNRILLRIKDSFIDSKPLDEKVRYMIEFKNVLLIDKPEVTKEELAELFVVKKININEDTIPYGVVLFNSEEEASAVAMQLLSEPVALFGMMNLYSNK